MMPRGAGWLRRVMRFSKACATHSGPWMICSWNRRARSSAVVTMRAAKKISGRRLSWRRRVNISGSYGGRVQHAVQPAHGKIDGQHGQGVEGRAWQSQLDQGAPAVDLMPERGQQPQVDKLITERSEAGGRQRQQHVRAPEATFT